MIQTQEYERARRAHYFDAAGEKLRDVSSRTTPQPEDRTPLGSWRIDPWKLSHGYEIEQLVEFSPADLTPTEGIVESAYHEGRRDDAVRYATWAKSGKTIPPIHVVQGSDHGEFKITDGHRRWNAAKAAGLPIRAWVSYTVPLPGEDNAKHGIKVGLTYELAQQLRGAKDLSKGKTYPPGTVRKWADGQSHRKEADGTWTPVPTSGEQLTLLPTPKDGKADAATQRHRWAQMRAVGRTLPRIRRAYLHDLTGRGLDASRVTAGIVFLLDQHYLRVGGEQHAARTGHVGASTLRREHVQLHGAGAHLAFTGKAGVPWAVDVRDPAELQLLRELLHVPGQPTDPLFRVGGAPISDGQVNAYLKQAAGSQLVTAKAFRTYHATRLATEELAKAAAQTPSDRVKAAVSAVKAVAAQLGHTWRICRDVYIHPDVLQAYLGGKLDAVLVKAIGADGYTASERRFNRILDLIGDGEALHKSRTYPAGTIRQWAGGLYQKQGDGSWRPVARPATHDAVAPELGETPEQSYRTHGTRSPWFKAWFGDWEHDPEHASQVVDATGAPAVTGTMDPPVDELSKVRDEVGRPVQVYHGTAQAFTAFDPDKVSSDNEVGPGFYFTESLDEASTYNSKQAAAAPHRTLQLYLAIRRPFNPEYSGVRLRDALPQLDPASRAHERVTEELARDPQAFLGYDELIALFTREHWRRGVSSMLEARRILEAAGHDGLVRTPNPFEGRAAKHWIAFRPAQIKSVDNVGTFDPDQVDMRKSLTGEELVKGRALPVGTVHRWASGTFRKTSSGDWKELEEAGQTSLFGLAAKPEQTPAELAATAYRAAGTKAPLFKSWFGDWESKDPTLAARISKVRDKLTGEPQLTWNLLETERRLPVKAATENKASVVVGPAGPVRAYHGTPATFTAFDLSKADPNGLYGPGAYFTEDKEIADSYREHGGREVTWLKPRSEVIAKLIEHLRHEDEYYGNGLAKHHLKTLENSDKYALDDEMIQVGKAFARGNEWLADAGIAIQDTKVYECYLNIRKPFDGDEGRIIAHDLTRSPVVAQSKMRAMLYAMSMDLEAESIPEEVVAAHVGPELAHELCSAYNGTSFRNFSSLTGKSFPSVVPLRYLLDDHVERAARKLGKDPAVLLPLAEKLCFETPALGPASALSSLDWLTTKIVLPADAPAVAAFPQRNPQARAKVIMQSATPVERVELLQKYGHQWLEESALDQVRSWAQYHERDGAPYHEIADFVGNKAAANAALRDFGYDGITHVGGRVSGGKSHRVWIAFRPEQIKAADNLGTFDPQTADIYKSRGYAAGTVRRWADGGSYRKEPDGTWTLVQAGQYPKAKQTGKQAVMAQREAAGQTTLTDRLGDPATPAARFAKYHAQAEAARQAKRVAKLLEVAQAAGKQKLPVGKVTATTGASYVAVEQAIRETGLAPWLVAAGVPVNVLDNPEDLLTSEQLDQWPPGYSKGATYRQVRGWYGGRSQGIVVCSRYGTEWGTLQASGAQDMLRTAVHEAGHALDDALLGGLPRISESKWFHAAYDEDLKGIVAVPYAKAGLAYFVQESSRTRGPEECFAECIALQTQKDSDRVPSKEGDLAFERYFARSLEMVRQLRKPERLAAVLEQILREEAGA